jgi:hypothetical protein
MTEESHVEVYLRSFYYTTRHNIPEHCHSRRLEILKYHIQVKYFPSDLFLVVFELNSAVLYTYSWLILVTGKALR